MLFRLFEAFTSGFKSAFYVEVTRDEERLPLIWIGFYSQAQVSNRLAFVCLYEQGAEATMVVGCELGAAFMGTQKVFDCQFFAVKFVQLVRAKAQWRCGSDDGAL